MILQLQDIKFSFPGRLNLLNGISIRLEKGNIYVLMGGNGSGKTTLFNLITGFLRKQTGNIYFKEKSISALLPYQVNRVGICRTFQDLRLISKLTVKENVLLSMRNHPTDKWNHSLLSVGFYREEIKTLGKKAEDIITMFFLDDVKNSLAGEISYGQQKLLNLACCVANEAGLLLLDEPVAGINPAYREKITILLKQLKQQGKTIFIIEHNTDFTSEVADEIFFLDKGRITSYKSIGELRNDPGVMNTFI